MNQSVDIDRMIALERLEAGRGALENACQFLEGYETNDLYRKAFKLAAKLIRENSTDFSQRLNAGQEPNHIHGKVAG